MKSLFYPMKYNNRELITKTNLLLAEYTNNTYITYADVKPFFEKIAQTYGVQNADISSDYFNKVDNCDRIVLLPGLVTEDLVEAITIAQEKGKEIFIAAELLDRIKDDKTINISNLHKLSDENLNCLAMPPVLYDINIPIISIMGLGEYCEKFTCELLVRKYYTDLGYKILQYGSKEISSMFGFRGLPNYIYDDSLTPTERTIQFNHDVAEAVAEERPDLIILGTPGGIMPMGKTYLNDFGQRTQIIANALAIDYTIVCQYYQDNYSSSFIDQLKGTLQYKFGTELSCICVSNTAAEVDFELGGSSLKYFHLDAYDITKLSYTIDSNIPSFSINNPDEINAALTYIYESMVNNIATI